MVGAVGNKCILYTAYECPDFKGKQPLTQDDTLRCTILYLSRRTDESRRARG
jgi:hypothetical protein